MHNIKFRFHKEIYSRPTSKNEIGTSTAPLSTIRNEGGRLLKPSGGKGILLLNYNAPMKLLNDWSSWSADMPPPPQTGVPII